MNQRPFLTAEWRNLLMVNFRVSPEDLAPFVPRGTEIDLWQNEVLASIVMFRFLRTRVRGVPVPFHRDFEEMNLRFYVRRQAADGGRSGVVFLREIVPLPLVAIAARLSYNEPYRTLPMKCRIAPGASTSVFYSWRAGGKWHSCSATASGPGTIPATGTAQQFLVERFWGYGRGRDGATLEYQVTHPRWNVWTADSFRLEGEFSSAFGAGLARMLHTPVSIYLVDGSAVTVAPAGSLQ